MKKFFAAMVVVVLCLCMFGCAETNSTGENTDTRPKVEHISVFETVVYDGKLYIVRDTITDVMYIIYNDYSEGGMTVMYNTDGTPLLYSEWLELRASKE